MEVVVGSPPGGPTQAPCADRRPEHPRVVYPLLYNRVTGPAARKSPQPNEPQCLEADIQAQEATHRGQHGIRTNKPSSADVLS